MLYRTMQLRNCLWASTDRLAYVRYISKIKHGPKNILSYFINYTVKKVSMHFRSNFWAVAKIFKSCKFISYSTIYHQRIGQGYSTLTNYERLLAAGSLCAIAELVWWAQRLPMHLLLLPTQYCTSMVVPCTYTKNIVCIYMYCEFNLSDDLSFD